MIRNVLRALHIGLPSGGARSHSTGSMGHTVARELKSNRTLRGILVACSIIAVLISGIAVLPSFITAAAATIGMAHTPLKHVSCPEQLFSETGPTMACDTARPAVAVSSSVAAGLHESVVFNGLNNPTSVHFAPDGKVFVTQKDGQIYVFSSLTSTTPYLFADLHSEVDNYWDRGMMSLALDPNYLTNHYIYVLYAYDAPIGGTAPVWNDACPTPPAPTKDGCVISGRLVRLTADSTGNAMVPGSEKVIINAWCQQFPSHSTDDIAFGPDGALYVTAGEGASFNAVDYGQFGMWLAWTGTNAAHSLNVMPLGAKGLTPGTKTILTYGSRSGPSLMADPAGTQLLLGWSQLSVPGNTTVAMSANGVNWILPSGQPTSQVSASAPNLLAVSPAPTGGHTYYWTWTGTNAQHSINLMFADSLTGWSAPVIFNESAVGSPSVGYPGPSGAMILIWTGTDVQHHLNISVVQN